ncbi:HTH-type transcriptional regulator TdfR [compost metagenome]
MYCFISKKMHCFMTVSEQKCLREAAERLYITRSPLGKSIVSLEENVGAQLFERTSHGMILTPQGLILYNMLNPIYLNLLEIERNKSTIFSITHNESNTLKQK